MVIAAIERAGRQSCGKARFGGQSAADCIVAALEDMTLPPLLAEVAARIEDTDRVPAEFSAGVLFAARLLADPHFDY
ncbi:Uncharacterised protein [Nocardia farcinica]|uniref:Uncharacterized protein n=1 Tax=Nocardia farcinica TaxID=37329 RepID=A0A449G5R7_NOCFR|nr:hypothetical protein [Nocardia farcinica]VFA96177.1 Uncharacterised protein [Nocardia farcinica]